MRLVVFVVVATLLPPLVAFCAYILLRRLLGQAVAGRALTATLAGLIALIALPLVARGPLGSPLGAAIVAVLTSAGAFAILVGSAVARRTLALCAAVAPLALLQFLAFSPARELLSARSGGDTTRQVGAVSEKPPATSGRSPPTVVLVVFDELPVHALEDGRGGIDRSRFPAFHGLARVATWYRFASSPGSDTYVAVPALVTGLPPDPDRAPVAASYPSSLFTRLRGSYRLFAEEPETVMCALPECERPGQSRGGLQQLLIDSAIVVANLISPPGLRDRLPRVDQTYQDFLDTAGGSEAAAAEAGRDDEGRLQMKVLNRRGGQALGRPVSAFRAALQALPRVPRDRPLFAFLHIELPHVPWQYFPDLGRYRAEPLGMIGILGDRWGTNQSQIDQERQRFLFQTGAADAALGAIVARLRALGLWDRSLVVVTADHGSAFKPGRGRRTPTSDNFAEIAGVPLFVKWPRQKRGRVENGPASTLDIPLRCSRWRD